MYEAFSTNCEILSERSVLGELKAWSIYLISCRRQVNLHWDYYTSAKAKKKAITAILEQWKRSTEQKVYRRGNGLQLQDHGHTKPVNTLTETAFLKPLSV